MQKRQSVQQGQTAYPQSDKAKTRRGDLPPKLTGERKDHPRDFAGREVYLRAGEIESSDAAAKANAWPPAPVGLPSRRWRSNPGPPITRRRANPYWSIAGCGTASVVTVPSAFM
jgi:hypothetical protein